MNLDLDRRVAGVLVPIFALRGSGDLGVGDALSLIEFVDWLADAGFAIAKILPINETGGDHSPYNAISSRALDPTTIRTTPDQIPDLRPKDFEGALAEIDRTKLDSTIVNYGVVKPLKQRLLESAFERFRKNQLTRQSSRAVEFRAFCRAEAEWLESYTLFRVLLENHAGERWDRWPSEHRTPAEAVAWAAALPTRKGQNFAKRRQFFAYVQWIAFTQWRKAKAHAESRGVALMGDIPFGVSFQSADVWSHPHLFLRDWYGGTPPDRVFKHDPFVVKWGQNWGIPLYDWAAMRADGFQWWRQRVRGVREFFDLFRIDHVLGFYRIYGFPWPPERNAEFLPLSEHEARERAHGEAPHFMPRPDDTHENKEANRREGEEYLRMILSEAGEGRVIGEDLGEVPDYVRPNLTHLGIAGYKIPAWEKRHDGSLIPGGEYQRLSLATYGTHDHEPLRAMWEHLNHAARDEHQGAGARHELRLLASFAGLDPGHPPHQFTPELHHAFLRALFNSNSWIAVVMITDLFGRTERFNFPGVSGSENWTQRLHAPIAELQREAILPTVSALIRASGRQ
jgi:4-alpha-glucanotransferase